ncbi:hypothetical protein FRB90_003208 [Tulasnella sp. 427]|nr:hypothetical protein FRB90_003208 [Tulasnella sp. 427]
MDRQDRKGLAPSASGMPRADEAKPQEPNGVKSFDDMFYRKLTSSFGTNSLERFPQTFNRIQAAEGGPYSVSDVFQQSQQSTSAPSSTYSSAPPTQPVRTFRGASTSDSGRSTPAAQSSIRSNLFGQVNVGQPHPGISQGSTHPLRNYYSDSPEVAQAGRNGPPRKIPSDGVDSSATIPRIDRIPEIELPWQAYTHSHGSPPSAGASVPRGSPVAGGSPPSLLTLTKPANPCDASAGSSQVDSSYHQGSSTRYAYSSSAGDMLPGGRDNRIGTNASRSGTLRAHYQAQVALRHPSSSARISSANSSPYYRPHASLQGEVLVPSTWPRVSATAHDVQETRRLASTEMGTSDYTRGVGTRSHALDGGVLRPRVADPMQKVAPSNGVPCTGSHSSPASNGHPPFSIFAANSRDLALANISVHSDDVPLIDENRVPSRDRSSVSETNGISHASTPYFTNLFSPEMGVSATGGVIDDHYSNHPSFPSFLERDETVLPTQAWTQGSHVAGFGVNFDGELVTPAPGIKTASGMGYIPRSWSPTNFKGYWTPVSLFSEQ